MRTEVAGGPARYRLDWDRGTARYSCSLTLDKFQYMVWVAWYHKVVMKGAIPFDMQLDSGLGPAVHEVHIVPGSYSVSSLMGAMAIAFTVECESAVYGLSDAEVDAYGLSASEIPEGFIPAVSQYGHDGPGGVVRDDVAGGVAAYALDWGRGTQRFNCSMVLSPERYAIWSVWFHRLILKGALTFSMPLDSGFGTQPHDVNIIPGSYSSTRAGGTLTVVSFAVEGESKADDLSLIDAGDLVALHDAFSERDLSSLLARIAQFANVDTLVLDF